MRKGTTAFLAAMVITSSCAGASVDTAGSVDGVWELVEFTVDDVSEAVITGGNAAQPPWVAFDGESMTGNAGCNDFVGPYVYSNGSLTWNGFKNAAFCLEVGLEEGSLMRSEDAFDAVAFHDDSIDVTIDGGRMVWSRGDDSLEFTAVQSPPTTEAVVPPRFSEVGRLDCSPGFASEVRVPDVGQDPLEIAQDADPGVVTVEPGRPLWHSGLDAAGNVVVEMALGDTDGADYQVWTCEG